MPGYGFSCAYRCAPSGAAKVQNWAFGWDYADSAAQYVREIPLFHALRLVEEFLAEDRGRYRA